MYPIVDLPKVANSVGGFDRSRQEHVLRNAEIRAFMVVMPKETEVED
ncbi:MAG: hypothetical protein OXI52_00185 [Caldilineaceae bacterium]|nr:hypothetical protein [Caldilineaceae bacterium]